MTDSVDTLPGLYVITDRNGTDGRDLLEVVEGAIKGGARLVQLREKDLRGRELLSLAERMRELTARYKAKLLINDRVDVALLSGADGVHLGVAAIPPREARTLLGPDKLIGVSTHSAAEARGAEAGGADFITFGPVFHTPSKARYGEPVGLAALEDTTRTVALPVFALGGIKAANTPEVMDRGAAGVAVISAVMASPDPAEAARGILRVIDISGRR